MARRKKPENETPEQADTRYAVDAVSNVATRSEKVSWDRKMDNMVSMLASLKPLEDKIVDLMAQKVPIVDKINELRLEMVQTCTHPFTTLVYKDGVVYCKFCNRHFKPMRLDK